VLLGVGRKSGKLESATDPINRSESLAFARALLRVTKIVEESMPMIAMTTSSSRMVKPRLYMFLLYIANDRCYTIV
jgi:hypothetical protein